MKKNMRKILGILNIVTGTSIMLLLIRGCATPYLSSDFPEPNFPGLTLVIYLGLLLSIAVPLAGLFVLKGNWRTIAIVNLMFTVITLSFLLFPVFLMGLFGD